MHARATCSSNVNHSTVNHNILTFCCRQWRRVPAGEHVSALWRLPYLHGDGALQLCDLLDAVNAAPDAAVHAQNLALNECSQRQPVEQGVDAFPHPDAVLVTQTLQALQPAADATRQHDREIESAHRQKCQCKLHSVPAALSCPSASQHLTQRGCHCHACCAAWVTCTTATVNVTAMHCADLNPNSALMSAASWLPRMRCTLCGCSSFSASSRHIVSKLWLPLQVQEQVQMQTTHSVIQHALLM